MLINEVETLLNLSKKSIRYYESEGLIKPERNKYNDYRTYTKNDIETLKKIKLLRELDVSIEEIKKLFKGTITLKECLKSRISKIETYEKNLKGIKFMCKELSENNNNFKDLDIDKYLTHINKLRKEGFIMNTKKDEKSKKIFGALLSGITFSLIFITFIVLISYFQFTGKDNIPWIIYLVIILFLLTPVISIGFNIVERIKEIKGGEEDEASKY